MQPLIKELMELWKDGIETFDALVKQNFMLRAAIHSMISDFPGYGNLSGWSTKRKLACPSCGFDTDSKWLRHGRKWCYMFHRRWLSIDNRWRRDVRSFVGCEEMRVAPIPSTGAEKRKSKDNYNARLHLKEMGIQKELHPKQRSRSNTTFLPKPCYQMTRAEKYDFLKTLKSIKPPVEFSSNISSCVQLKDMKLVGMKSYSCHMLMQEYLPISLRGNLPDHVTSSILDLCNFFKIICYKDLNEFDLKFLESHIAITLCKLEKIFPPSFFTVMVHLVIHLVEEVRLGGPEAFRWMYPIERDLLTLKSYVHNRAHPEGSIAQGYLAQESLTFCSRYLSVVETVFTRPIRNDDEGSQNETEESNLFCPGRPLGKKLDYRFSIGKRNRRLNSSLDDQSLAQAHRYVLFNVDAVTIFREEHKRIVKGQNRSRRLPAYEIEKIHSKLFSEWFKKRVCDQTLTEEIKWLARGQLKSVQNYSGKSYASSRDRHPVEGVVNYYGKLKDIIELNYSGKIRVVLFRGGWVDINKGCKKDKFGATLVNFSHLSHSGANLLDDPFIFGSQVDKVVTGQDVDQGQSDGTFNASHLHRIGDDGDDGEDVTSDMEHDGIDNEEDDVE
ncbi:putative transposase-associated domain-containing protein [Tanacetum coccineum]